jgi:hypothetical protein
MLLLYHPHCLLQVAICSVAKVLPRLSFSVGWWVSLLSRLSDC